MEDDDDSTNFMVHGAFDTDLEEAWQAEFNSEANNLAVQQWEDFAEDLGSFEESFRSSQN